MLLDAPPENHWIKIKLIGTRSNRSAIGNRMLVHYGSKLQAQQLLSQSSYLTCNYPRLHLCVSAEAKVDLEVYWPSGLHERFPASAPHEPITLLVGSGPVASKG